MNLQLGATRLIRRFEQLLRYYGVGLINTGFGFGLYTALIGMGLDRFVAQLVSHVAGMTFNYFMFRRHVFRGTKPALGSYIGAYAANYVLGLGLLWIISREIGSPYLAGLLTMIAASAINFFVLKFLVFRHQHTA